MYTKEFGEYYSKYIHSIYVYILRKVGDTELAEDICSEVWMKAMHGFGDENSQIESEKHFRSWVYTIARNSVIDHYRSQDKDISLEELGEIPFSENLAHELNVREELREVQECMKGFSPSDQEIFLLRVWHDLSYKEIAEVSGKSLEACRKSFSRSVEKLRGLMQSIFVFFHI